MSGEIEPSGGKDAHLFRQLLYRYSVGLVLALGAILAIILSFADSAESTANKLTQIGTGLAASIIFAFIYTLFANREFKELIRVEIAEQLRDHLNDTLGQIGHLNELFLPTDQYPAAQEFEERFNKNLTEDLCDSSSYIFRGTSAKYVPARISECNHDLQDVRVLLLDPTDLDTMDARARDRQLRPENTGKTRLRIEEDIRNEILLALVALFDCRGICDIQVGFTTSTSPVRIEIFDHAIYTSLYRTRESPRSNHPAAVRFADNSQTYQIFHEELRRQFQLSSAQKTFQARDGDEDLCEYLASLGYTEVGAVELDAQRQAYRAFIAPFKQFLREIGVARAQAER
jgi:hypothetical protein